VARSGVATVAAELFLAGGGIRMSLVARLSNTGSPVRSFGNGGSSIVGSTFTVPGAVTVARNGTIVVAGSEVGPIQANRPFLYRLSSGGELDSSFGTQGLVYLDRRGDVGGGALGLATRRGKVLVVAYRDLATSSRQLTLVAWLQG
jgi:hypothetical protein